MLHYNSYIFSYVRVQRLADCDLRGYIVDVVVVVVMVGEQPIMGSNNN